jgi:protein gp37
LSTTSNIEWTDATWNPVVGCTRVSAGCDNCYAVSMTRRLEGMAKAPGFGGRKQHYAGLTVLNNRGDRHFNGVVRCVEEALEIPLRWKQPRRIFVNSMSDLFHREVPFEFVDRVFAVMALCPQHTFQVLTKRPERMAEYLTTDFRADRIVEAMPLVAPDRGAWSWPTWKEALRHVWLGTSCENQSAADERIPHLLRCPAAVRFLSCEPLLEEVDVGLQSATCDCCARWASRWIRLHRPVFSELHRVLPSLGPGCVADVGVYRAQSNRHGALSVKTPGGMLGVKPAEFEAMPAVDWVIVGGESGVNARPCNVEWIRSIVRQCRVANVPCFVKQLGSRPEVRHPSDPREVPFYRDGGFLPPWLPEWAAAWIRSFDRKGGDPSEWPEDLRVREWPKGGAW